MIEVKEYFSGLTPKHLISCLLIFFLFPSFGNGQCNPFTYSQNVCSPYEITFTATSPTSWDFGDGVVSVSPSSTISHTYATSGLYKIKLSNSAGCVDSNYVPVLVSKRDMISGGSLGANVDSAFKCKNSSYLLSAAPIGASYCWEPKPGLSITGVNATASNTTTTTYVFNSKGDIDNLVQNGDFSLGNTFFSSDYFYRVDTADCRSQDYPNAVGGQSICAGGQIYCYRRFYKFPSGFCSLR